MVKNGNKKAAEAYQKTIESKRYGVEYIDAFYADLHRYKIKIIALLSTLL